jgi:electron transfer flavoprotein alpha subunit
MKILVLAETDGGRVSEKSLPAIAFAQQKSPDAFTVLAIGDNLQCVETLTGYGAQAVLTVNHPALAKPLAERYAPVVAHYARQLGADAIVATTSTFSRDVLARVAGLLDAPMLSDIIALERADGKLVAKRPIYSANLIGTFRGGGRARRDNRARSCVGQARTAGRGVARASRRSPDQHPDPLGMDKPARRQRWSPRPHASPRRRLGRASTQRP